MTSVIEAKVQRLLVVTTSYPNEVNASAGTFVSSFCGEAAKEVSVEVLAPSVLGRGLLSQLGVEARAFRYAPRLWERLAQVPGGIPAALKGSRGLLMVVPFFLFSFFLSAWPSVRRSTWVQANWLIPGVIALLPCLFYQKPLLVTLHGEDARKIVLKGSSFWLAKLLLVCGAKLVAVGREMQVAVQEQFPQRAGQILHINNGIEAIDCVRLVVGKEFSLELLFVGSLIQTKRPDLALEALAALIDSGVDARLRVVGDGPMRSVLEELTQQLQLSDRVDFLGVLPQPILFGVYQESDVLLVSSQHEGRSSVVAEALMAGMVIVASDVVGVRELLLGSENEDLMYPYDDAVSMKAALMKLTVEDVLRARQHRSKEFALQTLCSWSQCVDEYLIEFRGLVKV